MTGRMTAVVLVLALLGAVPATAQTAQQQRLAGVTEVWVLIESGNLSDFSASCGVTTAGLTTAANKALLDNGIRVTNDLTSPTLYVNVSTLYFEDQRSCVSNVGVELYQNLSATPPHSAQAVFGEFVLADKTGLNASDRADHGQRIRDMVSEGVEAIAVDIRIANQ